MARSIGLGQLLRRTCPARERPRARPPSCGRSRAPPRCPTMPALPLIEWASRNRESTASCGARPASSASSVSTMRSSRSVASSRKTSRSSASGAVTCWASLHRVEHGANVQRRPRESPSDERRAGEMRGLDLLGRVREILDSRDVVHGQTGLAPGLLCDHEALGRRRVRSPRTPRGPPRARTWPRRLRTPGSRPPRPEAASPLRCSATSSTSSTGSA